MKRLFVSLGLLAGISGVSAGQVNGEKPRHSFSVSAGAYPFSSDMEAWDGWSQWGCGGPGHSDLIDIWGNGETYYRGDLKTSGALSLSYNYRVKRWLEVGVTGTYIGFYQKWHNAGNDQRHYFYLMPGVNFIWLNKNVVQMYSGGSLGVGFLRTSEGWDHYKTSFAGGQLTLAGIRIGKGKFYFLSELGFGNKGLVNAGAGLRF